MGLLDLGLSTATFDYNKSVTTWASSTDESSAVAAGDEVPQFTCPDYNAEVGGGGHRGVAAVKPKSAVATNNKPNGRRRLLSSLLEEGAQTDKARNLPQNNIKDVVGEEKKDDMLADLASLALFDVFPKAPAISDDNKSPTSVFETTASSTGKNNSKVSLLRPPSVRELTHNIDDAFATTRATARTIDRRLQLRRSVSARLDAASKVSSTVNEGQSISDDEDTSSNASHNQLSYMNLQFTKSNRMFVRPCYPLLFQECQANFNVGLQGIFCVGTPGIGKSAFLEYVLYEVLNRLRQSVLFPQRCGTKGSPLYSSRRRQHGHGEYFLVLHC